MKKFASLLVALTAFIAIGAHADPAKSDRNIAQWYSNDMNLPLSQLYPGSNVGEEKTESAVEARLVKPAPNPNAVGTPGEWAANDMNVPLHLLYPGSVPSPVATNNGKMRQSAAQSRP